MCWRRSKMATIFIERELHVYPTTPSTETVYNIDVDPRQKQTTAAAASGLRTMRRSVSDDTLSDLQWTQPVDGGGDRVDHLPVISRPSRARQTSPSNGKQTGSSSVSCRGLTAVDRLMRKESLSSSCPELQRVTTERSSHGCRRLARPTRAYVNTELPSVVAPFQCAVADPSSTKSTWNSPSRRPHRSGYQQQQPQLSKHYRCAINRSRSNRNAAPACFESTR